MDGKYLHFSDAGTNEWAEFDSRLFLKDLGLEGLSHLSFVLKFEPESYDRDKTYALWELIHDLEEKTLILSMIERTNEGHGWDTAQSLEIVFDLSGKFLHGTHFLGYPGKLLHLSEDEELVDSFEYWIYLGGLSQPTDISTNLEDV